VALIDPKVSGGFATVETGGYKDWAGHGGNDNIVDDEGFWTGSVDIGWEHRPWSDYNMPTPSDDNDWASTAADVPNTFQYSGDTNKLGERWGQWVQWQSSCSKKFESYLTTATGLASALAEAGGKDPGAAGHVGPCMFGDYYSEVMGFINKIVGSWDPIIGVSFGDAGELGYVPRNASWIFGGSDTYALWPYFTENPPGGDFQLGKWWTDRQYQDYPKGWRQAVANGEFCRQAMNKAYPCTKGATSYAAIGADGQMGMCGSSESWTGSRNPARHYPLEYWQRKFTELRQQCMGAVSLYELKNKATLGSDTIDEACAGLTADQVVSAPVLTGEAEDTEKVVHDRVRADDARKAAAEAEKEALLAAISSDLMSGAGGINPLAIGAGVLGLGALYFILRRRSR
jgi:hypothetical protein